MEEICEQLYLLFILMCFHYNINYMNICYFYSYFSWKVGLHETIKAIVQIKDINGYYLSFRDMKLMDLTPKFSSDIIKIR